MHRLWDVNDVHECFTKQWRRVSLHEPQIKLVNTFSSAYTLSVSCSPTQLTLSASVCPLPLCFFTPIQVSSHHVKILCTGQRLTCVYKVWKMITFIRQWTKLCHRESERRRDRTETKQIILFDSLLTVFTSQTEAVLKRDEYRSGRGESVCHAASMTL